MRKDDAEITHHFRSDRFFVVSGSWYFTTRESEDFGPFENQDEAASKLSQYLDTQSIMQRLRANDTAILDSDEENVKLVAQLSSDIQKDRTSSH